MRDLARFQVVRRRGVMIRALDLDVKFDVQPFVYFRSRFGFSKNGILTLQLQNMFLSNEYTQENNLKSPLARCGQKMWPEERRRQNRADMMSGWHSTQTESAASLTVESET